MKLTIYKCDRCKKELGSNAPITFQYFGLGGTAEKNYHFCPACNFSVQEYMFGRDLR